MAVIIVLLLALAAGLVLYTQGFGFPTQESVAQQLFENPKTESLYVNGVSSTDIDDVAALVKEGSSITIDGVDKSMNTSTVYVTATTPEGGDVSYAVSMVRDMLGWKVSGVDLYFASQH